MAFGSNPIDPQASILSGTMPSPKTDVKKNLDIGGAQCSELLATVVFFITRSHLSLQAQPDRPVISSPSCCDPWHRTARLRSRDFCVACFVTKTIFYLCARGSLHPRFVFWQSLSDSGVKEYSTKNRHIRASTAPTHADSYRAGATCARSHSSLSWLLQSEWPHKRGGNQ